MPPTRRAPASLVATVWHYASTVLLFIPVYLVVGLIGVDWYVFVIRWGLHKPHSFLPGVYLLCALFTGVVAMILWSYMRTIFTSSSVEENPPPAQYFERVAALLPGEPMRTCAKCDGAPKPLRAHHCSICACVGFRNYKHFCLFIFWGCFGCSMYLIAGFQLVGKMFTAESDPEDSFISLLSSLLTAAFAISLLFFSGFHLHLVLTGQSTIEASLKKRAQRATTSLIADSSAEESERWTQGALDLESGGVAPPAADSRFAPSTFSVGSKRANWDAVFGSNPWLWFVPIDTLVETGYEFDFLMEGDQEEESLSGAERHREHSLLTAGGEREASESSVARSPRARAMNLEQSHEDIYHAHQQQQSQRLQQMASSGEDASMSAIVQELRE